MSGPSFPSASFGAYDVPRARRPGGLTAICVIAIVLGGLGCWDRWRGWRHWRPVPACKWR